MELSKKEFIEKLEEYGVSDNSLDIYTEDKMDAIYEAVYSIDAFTFDFDRIDNGSEMWGQITVYVNNLIGEKGYNVILYHDIDDWNNYEELYNILMEFEHKAQNTINYFNSLNK